MAMDALSDQLFNSFLKEKNILFYKKESKINAY